MGNESARPVEERLRTLAKMQIALAIVVVGGMFVVIALLTFALLSAGRALDETRSLSKDNCFNIEVARNYYESLDRSLTEAIRNAPPGANLTLIRELVDQARLARDSMITTRCQEAQG